MAQRHAPLIIAMHKEGKDTDAILDVLASKEDVLLHYSGNRNWKMPLRGTIWLPTGLHIMAQSPIALYASVPLPTPNF
jgi:hypothetical protein